MLRNIESKFGGNLFEPLENRLLLAASVVNGVMKLNGTDGNDTISVRRYGDDGSLFIDVNGDTGIFSSGNHITRIEIHGLAGNDSLNARVDIAFRVFIYGDDGHDRLEGGNHADHLFGGKGNDNLFGESGRDILHGGSGDDSLIGEREDDHLFGDAGNDTLNGHLGDDLLNGGRGNDELHGEDGDDVLLGGGGRDWLQGSGNEDILAGGRGDDTLSGGSYRDWLKGGRGNDRFTFVQGDDHLVDLTIHDTGRTDDQEEITGRRPRTPKGWAGS
jgi:Ca2+-binding RTX toxin-like protein